MQNGSPPPARNSSRPRAVGKSCRRFGPSLSAGFRFAAIWACCRNSVLEEGGYHVKGKIEPEHQALLDDAQALAAAGAFAIVLELVTPPVAQEITQSISVPTIGIGSGPDCDGQILVTPDLLGLSPNYIPRHVKKHYHLAEQVRAGVIEWKHNIQFANGK